MKKQTILLLTLFIFCGTTYAQNISGKWVGTLLQNPGGLATKYYFEMNLKQKKNIISGTSSISMAENPEVTGLMSIRGTFDGTYFYYEDIKILNQKGLTDMSDWCIKKCKFSFEKIDGQYVLNGHWTGNSRFGYCSPGTVKVKKAIKKEDSTVLIDKEKTPTKDLGFTQVTFITSDDTGAETSASLEIKRKGKGTERIASTGKHVLEMEAGTYHIVAKKSGHYDFSKEFTINKKDNSKEVKCILNKIRKGDSFEIANLQFERSKANITQDSEDTLNKLVEFLKANPDIKVRINGHTDNVGSNYLNRLLSYNRANAVVSFLVRNGIAQKRLEAKGFGSSQPIADNNTNAGRAKNRRVEFEVVGL